MKRFFALLIVFLLSVFVGHFFLLHSVPSFIMGKAMTSMETRGIELHKFTLVPRSTPQTQSVVRPSPDLAYSICLYDFSEGGVIEISAAPYDDYASVSFFDARTNNFATVRVGVYADKQPDKSMGETIRLYAPGELIAKLPVDWELDLESPTDRGIILIRRLAPTLQAYEKVAEISREDRCQFEKSK